MKLNRAFFAAGIFAIAASVPANAQTLGVTPYNYTGGGTVNGYTLGYQFNVLTSVSVTALAYYDEGGDGLLASHQVGLWANDGTLLASSVVAAGTGATLLNDYRLSTGFATPLVLSAGTYRVGGTSDGDVWGYFDSPVYFGTGYYTTAAGIQYAGYTGTSAGFADPNEFGGYDPDEFAYAGGNIVVSEEVTPEPASLVLLGTGLVGIVGFARRKRNASRA